jgi:hypothetical protein
MVIGDEVLIEVSGNHNVFEMKLSPMVDDELVDAGSH